jgi:hypothetical protein
VKLFVKNLRDKDTYIRPYKNRDNIVRFKGKEVVEVNLNECRHEVKINPTRWFNLCGFDLVKEMPLAEVVVEEKKPVKPKAPVQPKPKVETPKPTPTPVPEAPKATVVSEVLVEPVAPVTPVVPTTPEVAETATMTLTLSSGNYTFYNTGAREWQPVRRIKDWLVGKIMKDTEKSVYYKIKSVTATEMICNGMTKEDADKETGK